MIHCFEAEPKNLSFSLDNSHPKLTAADKIAAGAYWDQVRERNPSMFDGGIYSCNSFAQDGTLVTMGVNQTSYSIYKWARDKRVHIPGTYVMGTCMFVFDKYRDAYVFVQRAENVAFDTGKISGVGGVVDYREVGMADFGGYIQESMEKEIDEELVIAGGLQAVSLLGFYWDSDTHKTEFAYYGEARVQGIRAAENKRIVGVKRSQLANYVQQHQDQLEESTRNHLLHLTGKLGLVYQSTA